MYISSSISKEQSRPASHPSAAKNTSCAVGDFYITSCSVPLPFSGRCDSLIVYAYVYVHTAFVTVSINPLTIPPSNPPTLQPSGLVVGQKDKSIYHTVEEALCYLDARTEFWRQQKPMYTRKREKEMKKYKPSPTKPQTRQYPL